MSSKTIYTCAFCEEVFSTRDELSEHLRDVHYSPKCRQFSDILSNDVRECNGLEKFCVKPPLVTKCFDGTTQRFDKLFEDEEAGYGDLLRDPLRLLNILRTAVISLVSSFVNDLGPCKIQLCLSILFDREEEVAEPGFWSVFEPTHIDGEVPEVVDRAGEKIQKSLEAYTQKGSGWVVNRVTSLILKISKYNPLQASAYIPLPKALAKKNEYVVNVRNEDDKCFLYAVLGAKHNCFSTDPSDYERYLDTVDSSMLQYPVQLKDIPKFEDANQLSINVIGYTTKNDIHPLRCSKNWVDRTPIYLLYLSEDSRKDGTPNFHYCAIVDIVGFLQFQGSGSHEKHYCLNCFSGFGKEWLLAKHESECLASNETQRLVFYPRGENILTFKDFHKQNLRNFIVYADFESMLVPIDGEEEGVASTSSSSTKRKSKHVPNSYGYIFLGPENRVIEEKYYFGLDCIERFIEAMVTIGEYVQDVLSDPLSIRISRAELAEFNTSTTCCYCGRAFGIPPELRKVKDHCHVTGKYRGAAHSRCNLAARESKIVPICFHGLANYASHLLTMAADKFPKNVSVIAKNAERFMSMTTAIPAEDERPKVSLRFLDTFNFLSTSLATLVENYKRSGGAFTLLTRSLESGFLNDAFPSSESDLLTRKGFYPYEFATREDVFAETELPSKESFFNSLTEEGLNDDEYAHAQRVWDNMKTKNFATYHSIYQMTDVLLLAQAFEHFRQLSKDNFKLDPTYYISTPGLSWAAALRMTAPKLELFTHVNKHTFITSGIRGGLSFIAKRHAVANNEHFPETYDPEKPTVHLMYWDCNNLYGVAMSQRLPYSDFEWLKREEIEAFDVTQTPDDGEIGYILEVDLDYPEHLHDDHSCYPLAPEKLAIEDISEYSKNVADIMNHKIKPTTKLVTTLYAKKKYIVHYRLLKFYLKHGLVLKHVRKILKFRQRAWLEPFITANTTRRQAATNAFEKDMYKLMNNSTFGKTMERKEKRINVKLVTSARKSVKNTSLPHADSFNILKEGLMTVLLKVRKIKCDLPTYSGFTILELSKLVMFQFHYEYVKPKYGERAKLLFTDTDSLAYEIATEDIYADMRQDSNRFDTSNYPLDHPLYSQTNKQVLGKFKDEHNGVPAQEFVGLRSKMYSFKTKNSGKQVAKGIAKVFTKKHLRHEAYLRCLESPETKRGTWSDIGSKGHQITTNLVTKKLLSPFDDKRYILPDAVTTYPHGHYNCNPREEEDDFDPDVDVVRDMEGEENSEQAEDEGDAGRLEKMNERMREEKRKQDKLTKLREKRNRERRRREEMEEGKKAEVREKDKASKRKRRDEMTEEEKAAEKDSAAKRMKKRRMEMSEEERAIENEKRRQQRLKSKGKH